MTNISWWPWDSPQESYVTYDALIMRDSASSQSATWTQDRIRALETKVAELEQRIAMLTAAREGE